MSVLTLSDVLAMPALRNAAPRVVAGRRGMGRTVRWVHSSELADIGPLLREGDLLLSTGIAMPDGDEPIGSMIRGMSESGAAGLVIELGRRWATLPAALIDACEETGLPLVSLSREVSFAAVAQAVGERIVDQQLKELREAQRVHDTFTELSIAEAGPEDILEAVQRLAGAAVVLESEQHHVLDYRSGPEDVTALLADWPRQSRDVVLDGRTTWDAERGWLVTRVGKKDRGWGRLIVQVPQQPTERQVAMAERAAAALALHRLHDRQRDSALRRTHHELIVGLLADPSAPGLLPRCEVAGFPTQRRQFVGITFRPLVAATAPTTAPTTGARVEEVAAAVVHAAHDLSLAALVCHLDGDVRAVLSLTASAPIDRLVDDLAERVGRRHAVAVGAGRTYARPAEIDRTLRESRQVVDSARPGPAWSGRVHRLDDTGLRGLLAMLIPDERVTTFVGRQLATLREHDRTSRTALEPALLALLTHPASKSKAATSIHVSRPVLYDRLARIERLLGVDLDDPDVRASLHVALIADEITRIAAT